MAFVEKTLVTAVFNTADKNQAIKSIKSAVEIAEEYYSGLQRKYNEKHEAVVIAQKEAEVKEYVINKYKRHATRVRKYHEMMEEFLAKSLTKHYNESLSFIDFKFDPRAMGISTDCIIHPGDGIEAYERLYEAIKDMPYFKAAKGLSIVITTDDGQPEIHSCFRPHAKLILSEELTKAYEDAEHSLASGVAKFYENTTYFGD